MNRIIFCLLLTLACLSHAEPSRWPPGWTQPYPAFRVIGNLYGVGMRDLSVFLITSESGHILINTGLEDSTPKIRANVESLGFDFGDIEILLTQQAHFDHTAALAEIKRLTGARMLATKDDARVLEDGGFSDPHFGGRQSFEPVEVDAIISQDDVIELGEIRLTVHVHPGHTEGSSSYTMAVREDGRDYNVIIANMGTINRGKRLAVDPTYPGAAADFAYTYTTQKQMDIDIWVAAHGGQYGLHDKYRPGQPYRAGTFIDPDGFVAAIEALETRFLEVLAGERIER